MELSSEGPLVLADPATLLSMKVSSWVQLFMNDLRRLVNFPPSEAGEIAPSGKTGDARQIVLFDLHQ